MDINIKIELHLFIDKDGRATESENQQEEQRQEPEPQEEESRQELKPQEEPTANFCELAAAWIEKQTALRSLSTIANYRTALRSFSQYLGKDIPPGSLSEDIIRGYERWLHDRNICPNTISCYMRSLRSIFGKTLGDSALQHFKSVFTGRSKTDKRAIRRQELVQLRNIPLKRGSFLCLTRDLFLFSFYALGMPFVDMAFLRKEHIRDNQIVYHRHKTGQRICVPLEPCMKRIIALYERPDSGYVFPLLQSDTPSTAYREYLKKLNCYNRTLKVLATMAGISSNLTSYVSRHTWASAAYSHNVELAVISKGLGHANPQNTLIYIKEINDARLSEANHRLIKLIG